MYYFYLLFTLLRLFWFVLLKEDKILKCNLLFGIRRYFDLLKDINYLSSFFISFYCSSSLAHAETRTFWQLEDQLYNENLCTIVLGKVHAPNGLPDAVASTIAVKQGCPLSSTPFIFTVLLYLIKERDWVVHEYAWWG